MKSVATIARLVRHVDQARIWLRLALAVFLLDPFAGDALAQTGTTRRVSVDSAGAEGNGTSFQGFSISADGRFVAFLSYATNLVAGDTNGVADIFVRDRATGTTERVSVDSAGAAGNGSSFEGSISVDGRFVAFDSAATNLVAGDTNGVADIFVRDRATGTTERVSVDSAGAEGNGASSVAAISADGRFVAFLSYATNLVAGDTNGVADIFVRDRATGTTERVSVDSLGTQADGESNTFSTSISADGRFVAFSSDAANLVVGDTNGVGDIFVRDRSAGTTERISVDSAGAQGNGSSNRPSISADGRFVAFNSDADNLVVGDSNGLMGRLDIFVHDRATGTTQRVSIDSAGAEGNGSSNRPSISADGRFVAYRSSSDNLVAGDTNGTFDIFVHDRAAGTTERISVDSLGTQGNGVSNATAISVDGRFVALYSEATNLVAGDATESEIFSSATGSTRTKTESSIP